MNEGKLERDINTLAAKIFISESIYVPTLAFWVVNENVDTSIRN